MNPADFRVYDVLDCCAIAVSKATARRPVEAMFAWMAARQAAEAMAVQGSPVDRALSMIIAAAGPSATAESWRPALQRALDAASVAALLTRNGDAGLADMALADASDYTAKVPQSEAFGTVLAALWDVSREEVTT